MDASRLSLGRTLAPIAPFIVLVIASHLVFLDASTRLENRLVRVTTRDADGRTTTESKRSDVRMVDLRWRLGPYVSSTSTTTATSLSIKTDCRTLGEAASILLSRTRSWIGVCLFPIVLIVSIVTCRASHWHAHPTAEISRSYPPLRTAAVCMGVLCVLIVGFLLKQTLWPPSVTELIRWFRANVNGVSPFIYCAIVLPIAEEVVFRAGVCRILVGRLGLLGGIVLQALLFAGVHLATPLHVAVGFTGGIVLGMVYIYTRSLTAAILLHLGANCALAVACLTIA